MLRETRTRQATAVALNRAARRPVSASLLHDGQEVVVQVVKDPLGTKGARGSPQHHPASALSGVYALQQAHWHFHRRSRTTPNVNGCAPSSKAAIDDNEPGGYILRTVGGRGE